MPIPVYLEEQTEEEILERLLTTYPDRYDKSEGGWPWDNFSSLSIELVLANERARLLAALGFAQSTFGEFLDLRAEEHGVIRRPPVAAKGTLHFTGVAGTAIPQGTQVSTESGEGVDPLVFATDVGTVIAGGGTVDVEATALEPGAASNVGVDTVTFPAAAIGGVAAVTNPDPMAGGADEEDDPTFLARYLKRVRDPGSSGNIADYENWALEVPNVGAVAVVPLEDGPGTVTVAIADLDKQPAPAPTVAAVQDYIAPGGLATGTGKAPVGAAVTVEAATAVQIDVRAELVVSPGFVEADVQAAAEESIDTYIKSIAFAPDNDVRHAKVVTALIDTPGVVDALNVEIRAAANPFGAANIAIGPKEVAVLDQVTWL